jgi:tetratricopeptide (TPR) repeat protein
MLRRGWFLVFFVAVVGSLAGLTRGRISVPAKAADPRLAEFPPDDQIVLSWLSDWHKPRQWSAPVEPEPESPACASSPVITEAEAIRKAADRLASPPNAHDPSGPPEDPTARFLKVVALIEQLDDPKYPPCGWIRESRQRVFTQYAGRAYYSRENLDRLLSTYERFVLSHLRPSDVDSGGLAYFINTKMRELYARRGDAAGVEHMFDRVGIAFGDINIGRYMRARVTLSVQGPIEETRWELASGLALLDTMNASPGSPVHRRSLALRASAHFRLGQDDQALAAYDEYAERYPTSTWTWLAHIRAAELDEAHGRLESARSRYHRAAIAAWHEPAGQVAALVYSGRVSEELGNFDAAERDYRQALGLWRDRFADYISLDANRRRPRDADLGEWRDSLLVDRAGVQARVAELAVSADVPDRAVLERGRWLFKQHRWAEAIERLERWVAAFPTHQLAGNALDLAHQARVHLALNAGNAANAVDVAAIESIAQQPIDFGVLAARLARASLLWSGAGSDEERARRLPDVTSSMERAFAEYHARQNERLPERRLNAVDLDVLAIRDLVRDPARLVLNDMKRGPGYRVGIVDPSIPVTFSSGARRTATIHRSLPRRPWTLFLDQQQTQLLELVLSVVDDPRNDRTVLRLDELWQRFVGAQRGHMQPWSVAAYPATTAIHFLNAQRTKARVSVDLGDAAGTSVELEKRSGTWTVTRRLETWIS